MERISSYSSLGSLVESEVSVGSHDATEDHVDASSSVVVGEGRIEVGESLEHLAASFSDQHQQQANNNTREEVRSAIPGSFNALSDSSEVHAGHDGVAPVAHHEGASLEERLQQAEASIATNRARLEGNLLRFGPQHERTVICRMAEVISENHNLLIELLHNSNELSTENVNELGERLQNDCGNLEKITLSNGVQPETKEEGELKESKEEEMSVNFDTALEQMNAALDNEHAAVQFLRANFPAARHDQEELIQQQVEVHRNSDSDDSNATHPRALFEEGSQGSSQETIDQLTPPQENAVAENNPEFERFTGRIVGGTEVQMSTYTFNRGNAEAAEGRRDWREAHLYWMSAVNCAANAMRTIENHQQENNDVHHNPRIAESLTEGHGIWMQLQNTALTRARQVAPNNRCCTIA